jgi:hypothetical protein
MTTLPPRRSTHRRGGLCVRAAPGGYDPCTARGTRGRAALEAAHDWVALAPGISRRELKLKRESEVWTLRFPLQTGAGNEARTRDPNLGKVVLYH